MKMETKMNPKKAAIYARVSSQRQKEGETINSQVDALNAYASQEGYQLPENWIFLDEGISGKTLQRPALDELRDMIHSEPIDVILIYSPDRLARNYSYQLILLEEFRKNGVKVCFLKNVPVGDTPEAIMFNHFQGIFAEYERALIVDRSRRGRIYKAKQGNPAALPDVAFGYRRIKNGQNTVVEVVDQHASVVRDIFRYYVYEKMTIAEIARVLIQAGVKTPNGNILWDNSTLRGILKNHSYTGTAYFGKTERCEGIPDRIRHYRSGKHVQPKYARKVLPEEKWLPISIPPIISESDFELVQERLKKNKELASRNTKEPGLLQGLVFCGECGNLFYKRTRKYKEKYKSYYLCRSHYEKRLKKCANGYARQQELDDLVYNEVINLLQNPSVVYAELSRRAKLASNKEDIERQEVTYKKELLKLNQERDRLLDAYQSGLINLEGLKKRNQELDRRLNELDKEIKATQALKLDKQNLQDLENGFEYILKRIKTSADDLTLKEKRQLVRLLVEQVVVGIDKVKIIHCVSPQVIMQENCQLRVDGRC